jgi:hypothetical protein
LQTNEEENRIKGVNTDRREGGELSENTKKKKISGF